MSELGVGSFIYEGEIYDKMNNFSFDLDFYKKWLVSKPGSVLELCCGTGRLTIQLNKSGIKITGLDIAESMLEKAREKTKQENLDIEFVCGDMRSFSLKRKFSVIFIPFNSLQNTYSLQDLELIFANVRNHLEPDGIFILDIFNPSIHFMVDREKAFKEAYRFNLDDGREVVVQEKCEYDSALQVNRVKWNFKIGNEERIEKLDMRCFFPLEMDALLKYNNFQIIHKFGSFDESSFTSKSQKQIFICKKLSNQ
ncbi:MAG: class I SAM-dependent methyltransferase [Candidatus Riflebacteria bacterium]|nr:class I SAM-dependent methyltransferase [Candidatus Riflebacteria bacterium]